MTKYLLLLVTGFATFSLLAQEPAENWTDINLAVTDDQVTPGYQRFAETAAVLKQSAAAFCSAPGAESFSAFQSEFHRSMDAWQLVQHIQFGPVTYFNWNFRLQYWPDEKGTGARQLDSLIDGKNEAILELDQFARESVGIQGFPALERLLFEDNSQQQLSDDAFRCRVAQTIAANISDMASGVHAQWINEFRTTVANADERGFFESAEDATIDFMKALVEPVRRIQQQKIEEVIGESMGRERVRRAESWRSARSVRNIRMNVIALENLFTGSADSDFQLHNVLQTDDVEVINANFDSLLEVLDEMPDALGVVLAQDDGREQIQDVADKLDALFESLEAGLKNTDLYLGFNSLDGD